MKSGAQKEGKLGSEIAKLTQRQADLGSESDFCEPRRTLDSLRFPSQLWRPNKSTKEKPHQHSASLSFRTLKHPVNDPIYDVVNPSVMVAKKLPFGVPKKIKITLTPNDIDDTIPPNRVSALKTII